MTHTWGPIVVTLISRLLTHNAVPVRITHEGVGGVVAADGGNVVAAGFGAGDAAVVVVVVEVQGMACGLGVAFWLVWVGGVVVSAEAGASSAGALICMAKEGQVVRTARAAWASRGSMARP